METQQQEVNGKQQQEANNKPFYLNLVLTNKAEVVANKVQTKAGSGVLGRMAAFAANRMVSEEQLTAQIAEKLMGSVGGAVKEMGLALKIEKKYQEKCLVVLSFTLEDVDVEKMIAKAKGEEFANHFRTLLAAAEGMGMGEQVSGQVRTKVQAQAKAGVMEKLATMIPAKLGEQGIMCECQACTAEEQAGFFFELISKIRPVA